MFQHVLVQEILANGIESGINLDTPVRTIASADDVSCFSLESWKGRFGISASFFSVPERIGTDEVDSSVAVKNVAQSLIRPRSEMVADSAITVQAWEGVVLEVFDKFLAVKLIDKTDRSAQDTVAELDIGEIDADDADLVRPGAIFYWYLSYEHRPSGKKRSSMIRFRRTPSWTADDLKRTEAYANELFRGFKIAELPST